MVLFTSCLPRAGARRRFTDDDLPKGGYSYLPTQNEELACCFLRSPEESGGIPIQRPLPRRREASTVGFAGGGSAWLDQALRGDVSDSFLDPWAYTSNRGLCRYTPANTFVAAFHFTIALLPTGPLLITHPPVWYKPELVKSDKTLEDEELKPLVTKALRESKKKGKKPEGEEVK